MRFNKMVMRLLHFTLISFFCASVNAQILMNTSGTTAENTCSDIFYDNGGSGSNYSSNTSGIKTFYPNGGDKVILDFSPYSFSVESGSGCPWDRLIIYDGNSTSAPVLGTFCGTTNPGSFTSTAADGSLTVEFISDGSVTASGWTANVSCTAPSPMTYVTTTTVQTNSTVCVPGNLGEEIIGINVQTSGNASPLDLTEIQFNMNGTTSIADVSNVNIYYTGSSSTFATTALFGTAAPAAGTITVTGTQTLSGGNNYFWIAYDISASATLLNYVDAECTQVTLTSAGNQTPSPTAPTGNRQIDNLPPTYSRRIGNTTAGTAFWARHVIFDGANHIFAASGTQTGKTAGGSDMCLIEVNSNGDTTWTQSYGTSSSDIPYDLIGTSDGGYVMVGQSNFDYAVILKISSAGSLQWRTFIDESDLNSCAFSVIENAAGDLIVAGYGNSSTDMYVWRLDMSTGALLNSKEVWWSAINSEANQIIQTSDGGYLMVGKANNDFAVVKLTAAFAISWTMKWGSGSTDELEAVIENGPNDYTVFGWSYGVGVTGNDIYAMRFTNSTGTPSVTWEKVYDDGHSESAQNVVPSGDGGYVIAGLGQALGATTENEGVIVKLSSSGDIVWDTYIGTDDYESYCIAEAGGSSFAVGGLVNAGNTYMHYLKVDQTGYNCNDQGSGLTATDLSSSITTTHSTGVNNGFGTVTSTPAISQAQGFSGDTICAITLAMNTLYTDFSCNEDMISIRAHKENELTVYGAVLGNPFEVIATTAENEISVAHRYDLYYVESEGQHSAVYTPECEQRPSFRFYPQPFSGIFHIITETDEQIVLSIHDVTGRQVASSVSRQDNKITVELRNAEPGIYFATIGYGTQTFTRKIQMIR